MTDEKKPAEGVKEFTMDDDQVRALAAFENDLAQSLAERMADWAQRWGRGKAINMGIEVLVSVIAGTVMGTELYGVTRENIENAARTAGERISHRLAQIYYARENLPAAVRFISASYRQRVSEAPKLTPTLGDPGEA